MAESVEASVFHPVTIFFLIRGIFYMVFMKIFRYVLILYEIDAYSVAGHSAVTIAFFSFVFCVIFKIQYCPRSYLSKIHI